MSKQTAPTKPEVAAPRLASGEFNILVEYPEAVPETVLAKVKRHTEYFFKWRAAQKAVTEAAAAVTAADNADQIARSRALVEGKRPPAAKMPKAAEAFAAAQAAELDARGAAKMVEDDAVRSFPDSEWVESLDVVLAEQAAIVAEALEAMSDATHRSAALRQIRRLASGHTPVYGTSRMMWEADAKAQAERFRKAVGEPGDWLSLDPETKEKVFQQLDPARAKGAGVSPYASEWAHRRQGANRLSE